MGAIPFGPESLADTAKEYLLEIDSAVKAAICRLEEKGRTPECGRGCAWCCFLPVNATEPEGMLASAYMLENFPPHRLTVLMQKVDDWTDWHASDVEYYLAQGLSRLSVYQLYGPGCPMLDDGICAIYDVRPMGCRVHFSSTPELCQPHGDPPAEPAPFTEILDAVKPICMGYRAKLEGMGMDFGKVLKPFPELLRERLGRDST